MTLPLEHIEGKYEILQKIKEGGMGAIYKVRHRLLEEVRVIKVIRPQFASDEDLQRRFAREAKTAIRLRHPNIAQLYDFAAGEAGTAYMVMEYIEGHTLQETLQHYGPPSLGLAVDLLGQALHALDYLHRQGYVHRDISPDNLMMTRDFDDRPMIKLIDLGIVKRLGAEVNLTTTGTFLGKVRYSSPEQFNAETGSAKVDARSDVYSFGLLTYELLTGRFPIPGDNFRQLLTGHLMQPPMDFSESDPDARVPDDLRQVILQALEKEPEDRFPSAKAFAEKLDAFGEDFDAYRHEFARRMSHSDQTQPLEPVSRPGSTQQRLNEQFGVEPTPAPTDVAPPPPPDEEEAKAEAERREREAKIAELLGRALETAEEDPDTARAALQELLELEPEHARARELLQGVEVELQRRREEAEQRRAAESKAQEAYEQARASVEDDAWEEARKLLVEALATVPSHEDAKALLQEVDAEIRRREADVEREHRLAEAVQDIERNLEADNLETAARALDFAVHTWGGSPELAKLAQRIDEETRLRERREALEALLAQARDQREAGRLEDALRTLRELLNLQPEHREGRALRSSVEADIARREIEKAAAAVGRPLGQAPPETELPVDARATVPIDPSTFPERAEETPLEEPPSAEPEDSEEAKKSGGWLRWWKKSEG